ncbi:DNA polymerase III subunit beta [Prochlorothrix hollandica]|uniref:DNA polymerase III subunit beta n=1 Tax=Prochlorothrix hollandica TaxID=1223 RepID=UPI003341742F
MKLGCTQTDLSFNLSLVSRAVPSRPTGHPILSNVLLTADAGTQRVSLTAFDLSLGIQTSFPAQVEASGAITLPARLLSDIVTKLPSHSDITLEKGEDDTQVNLTSSSGHYQLRGMGAEEYPDLPLVESGEAIQLPAAALIEGLRGTLFATSTDETKQVLTGVHLTVKHDGLEFAATDGHRLAVVQTDNGADLGPGDSRSSGDEFEVTVPARALRDLERLLASSSGEDTISLYFDQGQTVFQWGDQYLTSRTLDGQYPNYRQLIPQQFERQMTVERKPLQAALDLIAVLADQKNNVVKLKLDNEQQQAVLSVEAQDVGSGQEAVDAQVSGGTLEIAFNVKYLMDGLKAMGSPEIQMQLNGPTSPVILTPLGAVKMTYLVMPVQIRT